jgi:alpha-N-arabinofuranosidase
MDEFLRKQEAVMDNYDPEKKVTVSVDEWGVWHAPLSGSNPAFLVQQNSIRDAILASLNLNIFARHAGRVRMANIAQMVNVLQAMILTDHDKFVLTPTYYIFKMYVPFQDSTFVPVAFDAATRTAASPCRGLTPSPRRPQTESCCLRSPTSTRKTQPPLMQTSPASQLSRPGQKH